MDTSHIEQMNGVMANDPAPRTEISRSSLLRVKYEDLGLWIEAYKAYEAGCNAVQVVERLVLISCCLAAANCRDGVYPIDRLLGGGKVRQKNPAVYRRLPRTGSTLLERVLTNHTQVTSLGETRYFEMAMKQVFGSVEEAMVHLSKCDSA